MRLPKTLQAHVALSCYAIVSNNFASFLNPGMRGENFEWDSFPEMMANRCKHGIFLNTSIPERHAEASREFAATTGRQVALELVNLMLGR